MVLPKTAYITKAYFGYAKPGWECEIKRLKKNTPLLRMREIDKIFLNDHYFDVTFDIQYYLFQGTTSFRVKNGKGKGELGNPILLVKGEWRGGSWKPSSEANLRAGYDAKIINVGYSDDNKYLRWLRKSWYPELGWQDTSDHSNIEMAQILHDPELGSQDTLDHSNSEMVQILHV